MLPGSVTANTRAPYCGDLTRGSTALSGDLSAAVGAFHPVFVAQYGGGEPTRCWPGGEDLGVDNRRMGELRGPVRPSAMRAATCLSGGPREADAPIRTADPFLTRVDRRWQPVPAGPSRPCCKAKIADSEGQQGVHGYVAVFGWCSVVRNCPPPHQIATSDSLAVMAIHSWSGEIPLEHVSVITSARGCGVPGCLADL